MSIKLGKVRDILTLPDFRLKIGESRDWSRFIPNYLEILKSRGGLPDLDLDPTQFLSGFYPPRDISPIVEVLWLSGN